LSEDLHGFVTAHLDLNSVLGKEPQLLQIVVMEFVVLMWVVVVVVVVVVVKIAEKFARNVLRCYQ
jgi:hypothetical protein